MTMFSGGNFYEKLGVRPVVNALSNATVLGGSTPPPGVMEAMEEANLQWVELKELLEKSGEFIAGPRVQTTLVLSISRDRERVERPPHDGRTNCRYPPPDGQPCRASAPAEVLSLAPRGRPTSLGTSIDP